MLIGAGVLLSLFPLALVESLGATLMGGVLLLLAWMVRPRASLFDLALVVLLLMGAYAWLASDGFARGFIESQISSYLVFLCSLRFFHAGRDSIERLLLALPLWVYAALCLLYLAVQVKVGYVYEVGVLEAFMLVRIAASPHQRRPLLLLLVGYLLCMYGISTRSTPLVVALVVLLVALVQLPRGAWKCAYLLPIVITPFLGFLLMGLTLSDSVLDIDDNAEIRLEMLKGASSQIGIDEFLFGTGFATPFRDAHYAYAFWHPLLNEPFAVHQVSNHNSLFDVFLRFGIFGYAAFCVLFLKVASLDRVDSRYAYILLFVVMYSLSVNAYLDSTRLAHSCAAMIGGLYILLRPRRVAAGQATPVGAGPPGRPLGLRVTV